MRRRTLTIALAGILALLGVVAVLAYARSANERAVAGLKAETVLAASKDIAAGTSLATAQGEHLLISEKVPVSSLSTAPVQAVTAANANLVVSASVATGQVLLQNMLASSTAVTAGPTANIAIPAGMVAVTVQLCATEAIANYLTSGAEVMVFATAPTASSASSSTTVQQQCGVSHAGVPPGGATTELLMSNIKVLSVTDAVPSSSSTSSSGSSTAVADPESESLSAGAVAVTLAVTPAQAAQLIQVAQVDLPYLALQTAG